MRCDAAQQFGRVVALGHELLEQLARDQQHLVGGLAATALAAHAVSQHGQQATGNTGMSEDFDLVLLIHAVTPVYACRRR
jgi:hypothetical protein